MSKFEHFDLTDVTYKTIEDHKIGLTILTPKNLRPGTYPLIIRFHGGFLITGSRMYYDWFPEWILHYAHSTPSILISPDYRLLPEARGKDILEDIRDLFVWLQSSLPRILASRNLTVDLTSVLTVGESAGGYLAVQAALLHGANAGVEAVGVNVRAAISMYGVLDIKSRFFTESYDKTILGVRMLDRGMLDELQRAIRDGKAPRHVSNVEPPERTGLALSTVQHGRYVEVLGNESELFPMENLQRAKTIPAIWLAHGAEDSAVPVSGSKVFAHKAKELHPDANVKLTVEPGEHGFDKEVSLDTPWLRDGLEFVERFWPAASTARL